MKREFLYIVLLLYSSLVYSQKVGIGIMTPSATLTVVGSPDTPSIPGINSTGILRIGVNAFDGIDIGKLGTHPYSAWFQSGFDGDLADPLTLQPEGGSVGIGIIGPEISAALEINSSSQGFLPPRMTRAQRDNISTPVAGLMIWCNNCGVYGQAQVFNGHIWTGTAGNPASGTPIVGDIDGGGVIAYIFQPGDIGYVAGETHGLIAKATDEDQAPWGCQWQELTGADELAIGTGLQNTIDIKNECQFFGSAANICYQLVHEGYSDWYLPSREELLQLLLNKDLIGGFDGTYYLSSSEDDDKAAWIIDFSTGQLGLGLKDSLWDVRAVRTF